MSVAMPFAKLFVGAITALFAFSAVAGNSAFSPDGKIVYLIYGSKLVAKETDSPNWKTSIIDIGFKGKDDRIDGISLTKEGDFCILCKNKLWAWTPAETMTKLIEAAPEKVEINDIACNPKTGEFLLTSNTELYYKHDRTSQMQEVSIRYPPGRSLSSPVFLKDGTFLFVADADIWHGLIQTTKEDDGKWIKADLLAYRYAPLAARETQEGTPSETGVHEITASKNKIYANFSRLNGSGWGDIIMLNIPPKCKNTFSFNNSINDMAKALASVEKLQEESGGGNTYICTSQNGRMVFILSLYSNEKLESRIGHIIDDDKIETTQSENKRKFK